MKMILKAFGLYLPILSDLKVKRLKYKYKNNVSEHHLIYLKELASFHQERQSAIESKTAQLVGQSSIVFSLFALFVPLFFDKFLGYHILLKLYLIILFLSAFVFYLFSIIHAARSLSIHRYKYSTGDTSNVLHHGTEKDFIEEQVKDLVYSINTNAHVDDQKGTNLILAHRTFTIANMFFAIMALSICILLLFSKVDENENQQIFLLQKIRDSEQKILLELKKSNIIDSAKNVPDSCKYPSYENAF